MQQSQHSKVLEEVKTDEDFRAVSGIRTTFQGHHRDHTAELVSDIVSWLSIHTLSVLLYTRIVFTTYCHVRLRNREGMFSSYY